MLIFQVARDAIDEVMNSLSIREANERNITRASLCTTYTVSDGDGESEAFSTCKDLITWQPVITLYFHNYTDVSRLHKVANTTLELVVDELLDTNVDELFDFGTPITFSELDKEDEIPKINITITCRGLI